MDIRQAAFSDAFYIQQLLAQLGYPDVTLEMVSQKIQLHQGPAYHLLVATDQYEVIAFISLHWFEFLHAAGKVGRINTFCVDQRHRGKGVGKLLMTAAEQYLLGQGCAKFEVSSNQKRFPAHRFYLGCGYVEDSKRFVKYV